MDIKEIQRLIKLAKKSGLIHVKVGDIELQFTHESLKTKAQRYAEEAAEIKNEQQDEMKALFWSVPDLDPLAKAE